MLNLPGKFYKDPIHKEISFDKKFSWIFDLTNTPEFKRLASINQLGVSHGLFPGATATRFSHCLGTYEITRRFIQNIDSPSINLKDVEVVLIAALLHDIGHGPASHCFEEYMSDIEQNEKVFQHEIFSQKLILNPKGKISEILVKNNLDPKRVANLLFGFNEKNRNRMWMQQLVSSELDADRIDYLLRDSYYTGANYGVIDAQLLIRWALFDETTARIFYSRRAIPLLENFLISRYHMYENVYWNVKSIAATWQVRAIFALLKEKILQNEIKIKDPFFNNTIYQILIEKNLDNVNLDDFILLNDHSFYAIIDSLKQLNDKVLSTFVKAYIAGENSFEVLWFESEKKRDIAYKKYYRKYIEKYQSLLKFFLRKVEFCMKDIYSPKNDSKRIWVEKNRTKICDLLELSPLISSIVRQNSIQKRTNFYLIYNNVFLD